MSKKKHYLRLKPIFEKYGCTVKIQHLRYTDRGELLNRFSIKRKRRKILGKGGITFVSVILPNGELQNGLSICHKNDMFDRLYGTNNALFRSLFDCSIEQFDDDAAACRAVVEQTLQSYQQSSKEKEKAELPLDKFVSSVLEDAMRIFGGANKS